jgi:phage/plasmid-associated DNA primase
LWKAWEAWCSENGEREGNQTNFASELKRRGFENFHSRSGKKWRGIAVLADQQHELSV